MMRESVSRPRWSVPSQWDRLGALKFAHDADLQGIIGRDEGRQDGHQQEYDNQREAEKPHGIARQRADAAHEAGGAFSP